MSTCHTVVLNVLWWMQQYKLFFNFFLYPLPLGPFPLLLSFFSSGLSSESWIPFSSFVYLFLLLNLTVLLPMLVDLGYVKLLPSLRNALRTFSVLTCSSCWGELTCYTHLPFTQHGSFTDNTLPTHYDNTFQSWLAHKLFMNTHTIVVVTDRQAYYYIDGIL